MSKTVPAGLRLRLGFEGALPRKTVSRALVLFLVLFRVSRACGECPNDSRRGRHRCQTTQQVAGASGSRYNDQLTLKNRIWN